MCTEDIDWNTSRIVRKETRWTERKYLEGVETLWEKKNGNSHSTATTFTNNYNQFYLLFLTDDIKYDKRIHDKVPLVIFLAVSTTRYDASHKRLKKYRGLAKQFILHTRCSTWKNICRVSANYQVWGKTFPSMRINFNNSWTKMIIFSFWVFGPRQDIKFLSSTYFLLSSKSNLNSEHFVISLWYVRIHISHRPRSLSNSDFSTVLCYWLICPTSWDRTIMTIPPLLPANGKYIFLSLQWF